MPRQKRQLAPIDWFRGQLLLQGYPSDYVDGWALHYARNPRETCIRLGLRVVC
jgi:hypothetical protein